VLKRGDVFSQGYYYHIYNRSIRDEKLFFDINNYEYSLKLVKRYSVRFEIMIIAYCLMPNHYHFLVQQRSNFPISSFVGSVFNAYVQALNKQRGRSGPLFEGRFKHILVDKEAYIVHLCRYIHLNPLKAGPVSRPEDWLFSNYLEWINLRAGTLKDETFIKERFRKAHEYEEFVQDLRNEEDSRSLIEKYVID